MLTTTRYYMHYGAEDSSPSDNIITSVRVAAYPGHDELTIFNRGAACNTILVKQNDGESIAMLLIPNGFWKKG